MGGWVDELVDAGGRQGGEDGWKEFYDCRAYIHTYMG